MRLHDVVISPEIEAALHIRLLTEVRKEKNRQRLELRVLPRRRKNFEPVLLGEHNIEEEKVGKRLGREEAPPLLPIGRQPDRVPEHGELRLVHAGDEGIVFNQEDGSF